MQPISYSKDFNDMNQSPSMYSPEAMLSSVQQMAEQSTDPMKRMLAQMALSKMQDSKSSTSERPGAASGNSPKMVRDIQQLIQMNRDLMQSVRTHQTQQQQLAEHNQIIASALGACFCWGFDAECPHCQGKGIAGTQTVNTQLFERLVLPFFQRLVALPESKTDGEQP
jgi:hypothetical protein